VRQNPVPAPKQTIAGFDQHVQVGTTKWATSLRNVNTVKSDPYGKPAMSVVVGHKEKQQARAVESMLNRVMARYPLDDPKIAETIHAFREHVQEPSMDDLAQLNDVLAAYIRRKRQRQERKRRALTRTLAASARKNIFGTTPVVGIRDALDRGRAGSSVGGSQASGKAEASRRPLGSAQSDSAASRLYLDVRKDEWYAVSQDQEAKANEKEAREKARKTKEAAQLYAALQVQQSQLDELWHKDLEEQRLQAQQERALRKLWEEKEKSRRQELQEFRKKEKIRAARDRQEFVESYQNIVKKEQQEENEEVKKIKGLIAQDKMKKLAKQAKIAEDNLAIKRFNAAEEERLQDLLRLQIARDEEEVRRYKELLHHREQARDREEEVHKAKLAAMEKEAQARHDKATGEEEKDAQRAALVQKQRQEKIDRENAQREAKRAADLKETMHYIQQQCADNSEREKFAMQQNRRESEITAKEFEMACIADENARLAVRARNISHRKTLQGQIDASEQFLKDGCGERGMTKFETQYNSAAIGSARRRRDEKLRAMRGAMTLSEAHRVAAKMMAGLM
jgi:hypothetical protein